MQINAYNVLTATAEPSRSVDEADLAAIVAGFEPQKIGLAPAWNEFYLACLAAGGDPALLQAIHDIKESIEDAQTRGQGI